MQDSGKVSLLRGKQASFGEEEAATRRVFASLYLEGIVWLIQQETSRSAQRTEVPEAGACIAPSLCDPPKTFLADSGTAHEEASSGSVLDMTGCLLGLSSSRGLSSWSRTYVPLGRGLGPLLSTLPKGGAKLALSEVKKRAVGWIFKLLLGCTASGPTGAKQAPCGP